MTGEQYAGGDEGHVPDGRLPAREDQRRAQQEQGQKKECQRRDLVERAQVVRRDLAGVVAVESACAPPGSRATPAIAWPRGIPPLRASRVGSAALIIMLPSRKKGAGLYCRPASVFCAVWAALPGAHGRPTGSHARGVPCLDDLVQHLLPPPAPWASSPPHAPCAASGTNNPCCPIPRARAPGRARRSPLSAPWFFPRGRVLQGEHHQRADNSAAGAAHTHAAAKGALTRRSSSRMPRP